jgi:hypothetical protein
MRQPQSRHFEELALQAIDGVRQRILGRWLSSIMVEPYRLSVSMVLRQRQIGITGAAQRRSRVTLEAF